MLWLPDNFRITMILYNSNNYTTKKIDYNRVYMFLCYSK